ncbi:TonB-dependent receptor [Sandarakinorhabdus rubra]|uniref:TonB-dependent receptor n=1 Tax=Sandarakinorhabdus rubra TaxID=2672568 RepID=UPI0013DC14BC|nr:TonB-dependent receptor [Sandarakinorhabdus rubra]
MITRTRRRSLLLRTLGVTTILAGLASPAFAEDAAAEDQDTTAAAEEPGLGEIIVTATRTAVSIQKVPISMQALDASALESRQVKGLTDFAVLLPSISFAGLGPGRTEVYFRGIVPAGGAYPATGYYLDDISINVNGLPDVHIYDIERIEALSGPQGTLFGAGSLAGTIRVITNKPKLGEFSGGVDLEGNKFGKGEWGGQAQGFLNIPVGERLAIRAMAYYRHEGGYVDNVPNNGLFNDGTPSVLNLGDNNPATSITLNNSRFVQDNYNSIDEVGGRLSLLWEPADGWTINPMITAQRQLSRGYFGFDPKVGDLQVHDFDLTRQNDRWYQAQMAINGHIGDFELVSATGYFRRNIKLLNDYTYYTVAYDSFGPGYESYLQFFDKAGCSGTGPNLTCNTLLNPYQYYSGNRNEKIFTQEVRLKTPSSWPFDVTIGGFYQYQKVEINDDYATRGLADIQGFTQAGGGDVAGGLLGVPALYEIAFDDDGVPFFDTESIINPNGNPLGTMILGSPAVKREAFYLTEQDRVTRDYAIFAEGHYNITPDIKLTGGIRYFWTELDVVGFGGVAGSARNVRTTFVPTGPGGCPVPIPAERLQCLNTNFTRPDQKLLYREQGVTYKIAADWQVAPGKMIYANYSTGFRPGGQGRPLRIGGQVYAVAPFRSEDLINYEIGFKTTWNNIFRFNAAIYLEKWKDLQYGVVVAGAQGAGITGNAGNAEVRGIEFDADLRLGKFTISTTGSYNDGKLKGNFCNFRRNDANLTIEQAPTCVLGQNFPGNPPTPQVAAADGTRLPRQPKFKGTTSVRYDTQIGEFDTFVQGSALYQTGATQDLNVDLNNLLGNTPGFVSFDFVAGVKKDKWTFDVFIQNAFDRRGELTRNTFCSIAICSGSTRTFTIRPQFFGMRTGYRF